MHIFIPTLHRPTKPTGVCRHAVNLAQCIAETKEVGKVTLAIGQWQDSYFKKLFLDLNPKIKIININIINRSFSRNLWYLFSLPKLARTLESDIIHLPFPLPFFSQLFHCPVVSTIHDLYPYEIPQNFGFPQFLFNRLFLKVCVSESDALPVVSQNTLKSLHQYFPNIANTKSCPVIYNYVNLSNLVVESSTDLEFLKTSHFLLTVAQHRKNKNLDILIEAFFELRRKSEFQSLILVVVGSPGPETRNLAQQVQLLGIENSVYFLSSLNDADLIWLYQNCQVFVIPSSNEGFCLPLVEALVLGCKVVCSDIPIFREVGANQCHYFDLLNSPSSQLVQTIEKIYKVNQRVFKSAVRFQKEVVAEQYIKLYKEVSSIETI